MFKRIGNLVRGSLAHFVTGLEHRNPEALLEVQKENLRAQIARYNEGLATQAGLGEKLMAQVRKLEADERDLRSRVSANLRIGNKDAAAQYALQLQSVTQELEKQRALLEQAATTYKELIQTRDISIKAAQSRIESLKAGLNDLKIKRATADLAEMAYNMNSQMGEAGATLDRLQNMIAEEQAKAAGRTRIARDSMPGSDIVVKETERKALADQALADFAAREGIALDPVSPDSTSPPMASNRTMGPQST